MREVEMLIPQYIKEFQCIGAECSDSCCIGWKITIDGVTYKKYKKVSNQDMRKKLDKYVGRNRLSNDKYEIAKIRLQHKRCPFLQEDKLCEIHSILGEESLSNTCAIYPRLNRRVGTVIEQGLTLSCPEAARLVLLQLDSIQFDQGRRLFPKRDLDIPETHINIKPLTWKDYFWEIRIFTIGLLQNRNYNLSERLLILGIAYREFEESIQKKQINAIPTILEKYQRSIDKKLYKNILSEIPSLVELQVKLSKELVDIRCSMGIDADTYKVCLSQVLMGLKVTVETSLEEHISAYKEGYEQYYRPFMQDYDYMIENYMVNYVFTKHMPINTDSPFESYVQLILHYAIVKLHLIGRANYQKSLTPDLVIDTIQPLVKTFEHNVHYLNRILKLINDNGWADLAHMAILIKN